MNFKKALSALSAAAVMMCFSANSISAQEIGESTFITLEGSETTEKTLPACVDNTYEQLKPLSFLRNVSDGYMRVVADEEQKKVYVEYYSKDFTLKSSKAIPYELDVWGGFFEGSDAYYLIQGQNNEEEIDSAEVIRVIKYDKNWNRLGAASITGKPKVYGGAVRYPFDVGCVETAEVDGKLYIVTGHQGYVDERVGQGHQGFLMLEIDTETMSGSIIKSDLMHSFSQYIQYDGEYIYYHEQSEGSRYARITKYDTATKKFEGIPVFRYGGEKPVLWQIPCYAEVEALTFSKDNIIGVGTSIDQTKYDTYDLAIDAYNIYVTVTPKDNFTEEATVTKVITDNTDPYKRYCNVNITKINDDRFMLSWGYYLTVTLDYDEERTGEVDDIFSQDTFHYIFIDGSGNVISEEFVAEATASDCQPVFNGSEIVFHTSRVGAINFYSINAQTGAFSKKIHRVLGDNISWEYEADTKTLYVTGTGAIKKNIDRKGWRGSSFGDVKDEAVKIIIGKGITDIPEKTFYTFDAMEEVYMSEGVISIGKDAFNGSKELKAIYIPSSVQSIGEDALWSGWYTSTGSEWKRLYNVTIYTPDGSAAEAYAADNGIKYSEKDLPALEGFSERLYTKMLERPFDQKGLVYWVMELIGGKTAAHVGSGFVLSEEIRIKNLSSEDFVARMYRTFLDREPDAAGLADWVSALDGGCSYAYILNSFTGSQEFGNICLQYGIETGSYEITEPRDMNRNLTSFVSRMYTKALGRDYDVAGLNDWTNRYLTGEAKVSDIAFGFIFSPEFVNKSLSDSDYVDTLYRTFFNREPDEGGKTDWMNKLADGMEREDVLNGFVGSQECINLVNSFGI